MVTEYFCDDSSVKDYRGADLRSSLWKVAAVGLGDPIEIAIHERRGGLAGEGEELASGELVDVSILIDRQMVHPTTASLAACRPDSDGRTSFEYTWRFRGTPEGLAEPGRFELRAQETGEWYAATLMEQNEDGTYVALAAVAPAGGGVGAKEVEFLKVPAHCLRDVHTLQPPRAAERLLVLAVPLEEPMKATLRDGGGEPLSRRLGRETLPTPSVAIQVDRERTTATASVGPATLSHFLSGEVRRCEGLAGESCDRWVIQVGPFARHAIEVRRPRAGGDAVALSVDGQRLVEASRQGLLLGGSAEEQAPGETTAAPAPWRCDFHLVGERSVVFEVYESTLEGGSLNSKGTVHQWLSNMHTCSVTVLDAPGGPFAALAVDGVDFEELPPAAVEVDTSAGASPAAAEAHLCEPLDALFLSYGVLAPYRFREGSSEGGAPSGAAPGLGALLEAVQHLWSGFAVPSRPPCGLAEEGCYCERPAAAAKAPPPPAGGSLLELPRLFEERIRVPLLKNGLWSSCSAPPDMREEAGDVHQDMRQSPGAKCSRAGA